MALFNMYAVVIKCEKEDDKDFQYGNTVKFFCKEKDAFTEFKRIVDSIWEMGEDEPNSYDYLGRPYTDCMKEMLFVSTDWLEVYMTMIENESEMIFD